MPTRTITEELCDVCYGDEKQKETAATERLRFSWMGKNYVLLACDKHVGKIRDAFQHFSDLGSMEDGVARMTGRRGGPAGPAAHRGRTLYSQLGNDEKERFRTWAKLPNARRIADTRVEAWIDAGRP